MGIDEKIELLNKLGEHVTMGPEGLDKAIRDSYVHNKWFTVENSSNMVKSICDQFLRKEKLKQFVSPYSMRTDSMKKIGLVLAGNIPMVGFHDILCCFLSGNVAQIKLSDKDKFLIPYFIESMIHLNTNAKPYFDFVGKLDAPDAVIATGSNNSAMYFERYFGKYPNIIRKNRNSIAVIDGYESFEDLKNLGKDVFNYFGLGCRNVSKLYLPQDYNIEPLMEALHEFNDLILHNKYKNNYDYNYALYLMNKENFFMNGAIILREHPDYTSRISCLHFEYYDNLENIENKLVNDSHLIQCITSKVSFLKLNVIPLGTTQSPALNDFADDVDTMAFLLNLN